MISPMGLRIQSSTCIMIYLVILNILNPVRAKMRGESSMNIVELSTEAPFSTQKSSTFWPLTPVILIRLSKTKRSLKDLGSPVSTDTLRAKIWVFLQAKSSLKYEGRVAKFSEPNKKTPPSFSGVVQHIPWVSPVKMLFSCLTDLCCFIWIPIKYIIPLQRVDFELKCVWILCFFPRPFSFFCCFRLMIFSRCR